MAKNEAIRPDVLDGTKPEAPAFPIDNDVNAEGNRAGLTAREYAAIALAAPISGTPWLDEMIQKATAPAYISAHKVKVDFDDLRIEQARAGLVLQMDEKPMKFKISDLPKGIESLISGALFDFISFLTTREDSVTLGASHVAGPGLELLTEFSNIRNLSLNGPVLDWHEVLPVSDTPGIDLDDNDVDVDSDDRGLRPSE